jgi:hypothetical protein
MFAYFRQAADAAALLADRDRLREWWERMVGRSSMVVTEVG